jgi:hypothetical protein
MQLNQQLLALLKSRPLLKLPLLKLPLLNQQLLALLKSRLLLKLLKLLPQKVLPQKSKKMNAAVVMMLKSISNSLSMLLDNPPQLPLKPLLPPLIQKPLLVQPPQLPKPLPHLMLPL